ncbi:hypothetical protein Nepgr_022286 [Nepenthes gracilis]|uniref:Uncharacterized protein n=1 Tax=Nepenthes gracilis TaxID=150966 RepID=A0AAD3XY19_NEPGR|nr:hypothetical protein Nepgr_022286 [Nepenthes gracilis]
MPPTAIKLSLSLILLSASVATATTLSAYEVLEEYDLPIGLLPNGVLGYELNSTTGAFTVYLNGTCTFSISSYELKYKKKITGVISTDNLKSLEGIYVKVWWFWLRIQKVVRDGDELEFSIGVASADFPVSDFEECPTCGCGFDCDTRSNEGEGQRKTKKPKLRFNGLARHVISSADWRPSDSAELHLEYPEFGASRKLADSQYPLSMLSRFVPTLGSSSPRSLIFTWNPIISRALAMSFKTLIFPVLSRPIRDFDLLVFDIPTYSVIRTRL